MNKKELAEKIARNHNLTMKKALEIVNDTFETITQTLRTNTPVQIVGFGTFKTKKRAARKGQNPNTGASIQIPETKSISFKAGAHLNLCIKGDLS